MCLGVLGTFNPSYSFVGATCLQDHFVEEGTQGLYYCQLQPLEDEVLTGSDLTELENLHAQAKALESGFLGPFKVFYYPTPPPQRVLYPILGTKNCKSCGPQVGSRGLIMRKTTRSFRTREHPYAPDLQTSLIFWVYQTSLSLRTRGSSK